MRKRRKMKKESIGRSSEKVVGVTILANRRALV